MSGLSPCPFCGTTPDGSHMVTSGGYRFTAYYCPGCKAHGPAAEVDYVTGDEHTTGPAATAWNRRADGAHVHKRALERIGRLGMDCPPGVEREDFYRDQLMHAIGLAARTVAIWKDGGRQ